MGKINVHLMYITFSHLINRILILKHLSLKKVLISNSPADCDES